MESAARAAVLTLMLATVALASGDWVIFKGQVNGPVAKPGGIDLDSFRFRQYHGMFWDEGYYHHMNFPDGSMITISIGFNRSEVNCAFVYGKPGMEPYQDYVITDIDEAKFDQKGFGFTVGRNRVRLEGRKYTMDINLPKTKAKIEYDIIGPSYTYGDGMVRYPDEDTYMYYSLPISWAKVKVEAVLDGKECKLDGSGNMNHDAGLMFAAYTPTNWQVFWFFGDDHALVVTDHYTHPKFGRMLTQRLVFVDKDGRMFTSTSFPLQWDDWVAAKDVPFRYPRHFTLTAEGGGEKIEVEVKMQDILLVEDLYSNLPTYMRIIVERLMRNCWTVDGWSDYAITYRYDGATETYKGRGVLRWTNLEEEKK
ncbi:MAG: hypothetical protein A2V67_00580 [Deltaproteobacteria bacterium RBG_13_61_14]|nr:MAG: hypothetical protein A2V67_00580 [Deltaproteobacteria bacterium RBG_13_61_14]